MNLPVVSGYLVYVLSLIHIVLVHLTKSVCTQMCVPSFVNYRINITQENLFGIIFLNFSSQPIYLFLYFLHVIRVSHYFYTIFLTHFVKRGVFSLIDFSVKSVEYDSVSSTLLSINGNNNFLSILLLQRHQFHKLTQMLRNSLEYIVYFFIDLCCYSEFYISWNQLSLLNNFSFDNSFISFVV